MLASMSVADRDDGSLEIRGAELHHRSSVGRVRLDGMRQLGGQLLHRPRVLVNPEHLVVEADELARESAAEAAQADHDELTLSSQRWVAPRRSGSGARALATPGQRRA